MIIKKDSDMDILILFLLQLIHETNVKARVDSKIEALMKKKNSEQLCYKKRIQLESKEQAPDYYDALRVYRFMRIKMKISYHALKRGRTVFYHFIKTIHKSYFELKKGKPAKMLNLDYLINDISSSKCLEVLMGVPLVDN